MNKTNYSGKKEIIKNKRENKFQFKNKITKHNHKTCKLV